MADAFRFFGLSCPSGGSFYVCQNNATEFIGCCTTNPCTAEANGHCPTANLRASSFSADTYTDLPRQDCDDAQSIQIWYTCKFNQPPFMGCCASNPCAKGACELSDLRPAKLSGEPVLRESFLQPGVSATSTGTAASATASKDAAAAPSGGLSSGAIGGIVVGVVLLIIGVVAFFLYRRGWRARVNKEKVTPSPIGAGMYHDTVPPGQPSPGLTVNGSEYRESYLSGQTYYQGQYGSPKPEMQYPPGYDAKNFHPQHPSATPYGHYGHLSQVSHTSYAPSPPVELPLSYPAVHELPTSPGVAQLSPQTGNDQRPRTSLDPQTVSPSITPMSSPRMPEEATFTQHTPGGNNQYQGDHGSYDRRY
ncbi:hypothetical protein OQA88_4837 [Cercophora sp. LCS_1]